MVLHSPRGGGGGWGRTTPPGSGTSTGTGTATTGSSSSRRPREAAESRGGGAEAAGGASCLPLPACPPPPAPPRGRAPPPAAPRPAPGVGSDRPVPPRLGDEGLGVAGGMRGGLGARSPWEREGSGLKVLQPPLPKAPSWYGGLSLAVLPQPRSAGSYARRLEASGWLVGFLLFGRGWRETGTWQYFLLENQGEKYLNVIIYLFFFKPLYPAFQP